MRAFTLSDAIKKRSNDPEFNKYYKRELLINKIAKIVVNIRRAANLTQNELAERAGTKQSVIARLESGSDSRVPSLDLLIRVASASNATLELVCKPESSKTPVRSRKRRVRIKKRSASKAA